MAERTASGNWRKSSFSGANGGNCVEVGAWRKSTYSGSTGGQCVEVASTAGVRVRDTTNRDGETLAFSVGAWQDFVSALK